MILRSTERRLGAVDAACCTIEAPVQTTVKFRQPDDTLHEAWFSADTGRIIVIVQLDAGVAEQGAKSANEPVDDSKTRIIAAALN
jgi:hypothetical protein